MKNNELTEVNDKSSVIIEPFISRFTELSIEHLIAQRDALVAENAALREIIDSVTDLDNEPQYHEAGMGCGLEDRGIADRYEAMRHGWDSAMERVYGEVIPSAEELEFKATDAAIAEIKAQGVDEFSSEIGKLCDELKLGSMSWKAAKSIVMRAVTFAANLRAGRKG